MKNITIEKIMWNDAEIFQLSLTNDQTKLLQFLRAHQLIIADANFVYESNKNYKTIDEVLKEKGVK